MRQSASSLLSFCNERNVGTLIGSPLCMGYLSGKDPRKMPKNHHHSNMGDEIDFEKLYNMYDWRENKGIGLQQINNNFILKHPGVTSVLIGATSPDEVLENIETVVNPLDSDLYNEFLDEFGLSKSVSE